MSHPTDPTTGQAIYRGHPGSWGRTRGPKNLAGANGTAVTPLADTDDLQGITASTEGYATENQRYLHVLVEDTNEGTPAAITIYGYCHAFLRWFPIPESTAAGGGANTQPTAATITPDTGNTAPVATPPEEQERKYRVYHILGVDRVAFVNASTANVNIFAACSTF